MEPVQLLAIFFAALLINNIILLKFLALCSFFGISNSIKTSWGMGLAVIFVIVMASAVTWPIYHWLLQPFGVVYLRTAVFILVIAGLVQLEEMFIKKYSPPLYRAMGIYLPLITTNCAVLAVAFLMVDYQFNFIESLVYALGVSGGYTLAIVLFAAIRERLASAPIPTYFRGYPLAFITAALMSLAFLGFANLFGL